jgi:hypothetical protein
MRKHNWFVRLAVVTVLTAGLSEAAETIRYEEIPQHLGNFGSVLEHRGFKVVTLDGKEHSGRRLRLEPHQVWVFRGKASESLSSDQISRIEISQGGRFFHHVVIGAILPPALAAFVCGGGILADGTYPMACIIPLTVLASPVWAYLAVTAPFYLASDGVAFLIPPKVYEIVH